MAITMEIMNNSELVKFAESELIKSIKTENVEVVVSFE